VGHKGPLQDILLRAFVILRTDQAVVAQLLQAAKPFIERQCLIGRFVATTDARFIQRVLQDTSGHA
jgi:hypothetical protein